jgi:hypothetical protein
MRPFSLFCLAILILAFALLSEFRHAENYYETIGSQADAISHGATIIEPGTADRLNIPRDSWEKRSDGVSIAMILKTASIQDTAKSRIDVYIKNVLDSDKFFFAVNNEIIIFYIDERGVSQPLKESYGHSTIDEAIQILIKPGQTLLRTCELTPAEFTLVKQHDIKCLFRIGDKDSKEVKIESAPRRLSPSL